MLGLVLSNKVELVANDMMSMSTRTQVMVSDFLFIKDQLIFAYLVASAHCRQGYYQDVCAVSLLNCK
jgi:hypothetical protein